ncbi:MAG: hypothetical protein M0Q53_13245 [Prolixibacteraceae bacterium]|jgi:hypothetical protein|nr:hypothetical protein [Prolixibacteraceae bacterium]
MKTFLTFSLTLVLVLTITSGFSQNKPATKIFRLETKDGNGYIGEIVSIDSAKVLFRSQKLGDLTIQPKDIKSMVAVDSKQLKGGKFWFANPQSTRSFFSPNGYGLKKGEGYYQNIWVLMNSFAVGINDYVSVGGGLIPAFLFAGASTPAWITAKVSIPVSKDKFNLGAGVLAGSVLGESNTGFGIFYGLATVGSRDRNISLGVGYGFADGSIASSPMINLMGMYRVGPRSYLLTENYFFAGSDGAMILMVGARQIIREAGLDYGLMIPAGNGIGSLVAVPWLGITIPFGRR